jgi:hypothetical protein
VRDACDLDPVFHDVLSILRSREGPRARDGLPAEGLQAREGNGPPLFSPGERIVAAAQRFARTPDQCARFATGVRSFSVNPDIAPLEPGQPKTVFFVGDVLYAAGFTPPVEGIGYAPAACWPFSPHFQPIGPAWARPGDLLLVGQQIEVITGILDRPSHLITLGARALGLVEDAELGRWLPRARRQGAHYVAANQTVHVLRVPVQGP